MHFRVENKNQLFHVRPFVSFKLTRTMKYFKTNCETSLNTKTGAAGRVGQEGDAGLAYQASHLRGSGHVTREEQASGAAQSQDQSQTDGG